ncbi:MAG: UvrD-helicase domain-containing protein [Acidobacteriia bacterium]|nr:UvrD-helicase domain-containing protein [Terriglobia bacterium]
MTHEQMVQITGEADAEIQRCLEPGKFRSFFLYAGAGSGKTGSLVAALKWIQKQRRETLWTEGRRVAVITYTNAASDEIKRRIEYDAFIAVSTIHAFAWELIGGFENDIRAWLGDNLLKDLAELLAAQSKGRAGTKAAVGREHSIRSKTERLNNLNKIRKFVYSPTGDNRGRDALSHSEVIGISSDLLRKKPSLQHILIDRFPILFVDESQDTNRYFMDALLEVQAKHARSFCLGLFGDTMQRIYTEGKIGLAQAVPGDWAKPAKLINYRCPKRVLRLINRIREEEDGQEQTAPADAIEGVIRLFVTPAEGTERVAAESEVTNRMAEITHNPSWPSTCKTLILEHHMAAIRMGFSGLFEPLYAVDRYSTPLIEGTLPQLSVFTSMVSPLLDALRIGDRFRAAAVVRKYSPILDPKVLKAAEAQLEKLEEARKATDELFACFKDRTSPSIGEVVGILLRTRLFELPSVLVAALEAQGRQSDEEDATTKLEREEELQAWDAVLRVPFDQVEHYAHYIADTSPFGTHQGVKGLEFPNVMVIIDDSGARGFMFSYEKLFGLKAKSDTDRNNEAQGIETAIDRTRRLMYVTCSRTKESLAIVAYCSDPGKLQNFLVSQGWFNDQEVEIIT